MFAKKYQVKLPENISQAELIAALYDETSSGDWKVRRKLFSKLPESFAIAVAKEYAENFRLGERYIANFLLQSIIDELNSGLIGPGCSDDDILGYAKRKAQEFSRLRDQFRNPCYAVQALCDIAFHKYGVIPPLKSRLGSSEIPVTVTAPGTEKPVTVTVSVTGVLNRLCDEKWWRRALRNVTIRNVEAKAIQLGLVRNVTKYVSNDTFERICKQKRRNRKILEHTFAINELNQEYSLQELADLSVSNPKLQRNELMTRLAGFDAIALTLGHEGMVFTVTCPSRMHARHQKTDTKNSKYNQTNPREAQKYLNGLWARVRAELARQHIKVYGFRIVEPHHDATPHWHALLYMEPNHAASVTKVIRHYAMEDSPNEKGAQDHRLHVITIDRKKGTGVSYLAKYISKGIDGLGLDTDIDGSKLGDTPKRVKAWAITWGNRQFQQIGGPPVTLWRELRKITGNGLTGIAKELWEAANEGEWDRFTMLMGGPQAKRKDFPIQIAKQWNDKPNRYQEPIGNEIIGVAYGNVVIPTRIHQWAIQYRPDKQYLESNNLPIENPPNSNSLIKGPLGPSFEFDSRGALAPLEFCQ